MYIFLNKFDFIYLKGIHNIIYIMQPSKQQQDIIEVIKQGGFPYADAVPGAGKSTLSFCIARQCPDKSIIVLTFSKDLKQESRDKIKSLGLTNITSESYNSFGVRYYHHKACDDIEYVVTNNIPLKNIPPCDLLILDETQDMTFNVYCFVHKFIKDHGNIQQIMVLGDKDQHRHQYSSSHSLANLPYQRQDWIPVILVHHSHYRPRCPLEH